MLKRINTLLLSVGILCIFLLAPGISYADVGNVLPYKQTFIVTGYYSPLPGQEHYVTGSYESDVYLNGRGTNGASGSEVFPGMLAAPKSYPFGFKIDIPGVGISEIQDRGGAIVNAGERGHEYDRLDIWMGAGDKGLRRALLWGKRIVMTTVYGVRPELNITAGFDNWDGDELALVQYWKRYAPFLNDYGMARLFSHDLWLGQTSPKVEEMEILLSQLGYFTKTPDAIYDDVTATAVFNFQRDNDIVYSLDELGAGHFGPQTRVTIEKAKELFEKGEYINQTVYLEKIQLYDDLKEEFTVYTDELSIGSRGLAVDALQKDLIVLGYLRTEVTGYYGEVTENAVRRFQMKMGIIASADAHGAGIVGPKTQSTLNALFDKRIEAKGLIALKREMTNDSVLLASASIADVISN